MNNLSRWVKENPQTSKIIIAISHILIILNGLFLGFITYVHDYQLGNWWIPFLGHLFFLAYVLYPDKKRRKGLFKYSYLRQKALDFTLMITHFLILVVGVNHFAFAPDVINQSHRQESNRYESNEGEPNQYGAQLVVLRTTPKMNKKEKRKLRTQLRKSFKKMKKKLKAELRKMKKEMKKRKNKKGRWLLTALLVAITLGFVVALGFLVFAISFKLDWYGGRSGLSTVVLLLGGIALIWLTILMIKGIFKEKAKD